MRLNLLTVIFVLLAAAGFRMFLIEQRAIQASDQLAFQGRPAPDLSPGMSLSTTRRGLSQCTENLGIPVALLRSGTDRQQIARACGRLADETLRTMPTNGLAYLVQAMSAYHLDQGRLPLRALSLSNRYSPSEGWLAERRFAFSAGIGMQPGADAAQYLVRDIEILFATQSGAELLASYHVRRPDWRPIIAAVAGTRPAAQQQRLVNQIRIREAGT